VQWANTPLILETPNITESEATQRNRTVSELMTFAMKSHTRIGCWNVRTLMEGGRLLQATKEISTYNICILGLSETRWTGYGEVDLREGKNSYIQGKKVKITDTRKV
jgi:hypothetical protein